MTKLTPMIWSRATTPEEKTPRAAGVREDAPERPCVRLQDVHQQALEFFSASTDRKSAA
ncbi:MAG: hypothetical protein U0790_18890 [Isosphaeraceae bacterium]